MQINGNTFYIWSNDSKTITTNKIQGFEQTYFSLQTDDKIFLLEKKYNHNFFLRKRGKKSITVCAVKFDCSSGRLYSWIM